MDDKRRLPRLRSIATKLKTASNLLDAGADMRVIRAELEDARALLVKAESDTAPFPLVCECHLKDDPSARHVSTTREIAEQAYANYMRYAGRLPIALPAVEKQGGFGCVEIRLLLSGLNPNSGDFARGALFTPKLRHFLRLHPVIKL